MASLRLGGGAVRQWLLGPPLLRAGARAVHHSSTARSPVAAWRLQVHPRVVCGPAVTLPPRRHYAKKKAKAQVVSKRKQAAKARRQVLLETQESIESSAASEQAPAQVFTPKALGTNLMRCLELEEIAGRLKQRGQEVPEFYAGSVLAVTLHPDANTKGDGRIVRGICIGKFSRGIQSSFLLRNVFGGVPYEVRLFTYSPKIARIDVLMLARRRRAKLYYLRDRPEKQSTVANNFEPVPHPDGPIPVVRAR